MKPLKEFPTEACQKIRGILCDLDDTLTIDGRVLPNAFSALWRAFDAGLRVVVVTGRPAGWVDHLARMWPVDAVIGENGAFYFYMKDGRMQRRWTDGRQTREKNRENLNALSKHIPNVVPGSAVSADQFCRATDLAIDFCEDVPPLSSSAVSTIVEEFEKSGATAKVSSIHVNGWFGDYDKLKCFRALANDLWGENLEEKRDQYVFCGDSPNDEPMFEFFPLATAVANIVELQDRLNHLPSFVTPSRGGHGFAELVSFILSHRQIHR